jgi:hypothetical protein
MRIFPIGRRGLTFAAPAMAEEGVSLGVGSVGFHVGVHERNRDRDWRYH